MNARSARVGPRASRPGRPAPRQVLAGEHSLGDWREHDLADAFLPRHSGITSASITRQIMLLLGLVSRRSCRKTHLPGDPDRGAADLVGPPLGHAHVEHLALGRTRFVEGAERSPPAAVSWS